jgi:regulator of protease activity HflC (stomatin/prohibitin superfamily)
MLKSMRILTVAAILAAAGLLSACSMYSPDPGHEVVLVDKPMFFGHGGVEQDSVRTGRTIAALTTEGYDVNMQPQRFEVLLSDAMTSDGVPLTFHTVIVAQVTDSVQLITKFGDKWYNNNLDQPFSTIVRQAVRKHGMNETAISTTALDQIDEEVRSNLDALIKEKSLPVKLVTVSVGRANPPDAIKNQRIQTAEQEQRIQTEQQTKLAEDQRKLAETSRAEADNAYREAMHLSPEQYIELQRIAMLKSVCGAEKTGCTFIQGNAAAPVYNVK